MRSSTAHASFETRSDIPMTRATYAKWVRTETNWNTPDENIEFLMDKKGLECVSTWKDDEMVSTGTAVPTFAPLSPSHNKDEQLYFFNNVVTAKKYRRKGLARQVVGELLSNCERRG